MQPHYSFVPELLMHVIRRLLWLPKAVVAAVKSGNIVRINNHSEETSDDEPLIICLVIAKTTDC